MVTAILTSERMRDLLSHTILELLESWPDMHREIFVRAHYWGDSLEAISDSLGVDAGEILGCSAPKGRPGSPPPTGVAVHFRADKAMSPETARHLGELILYVREAVEREPAAQ